MVELATLGTVIGVQREMNGTVQWLSFLTNVGGESSVLYLEGCFGPDPSFSSLYVVPDFPSMHFWYFFTTSLLLPLLFPCLYSAVGCIALIIHVLGVEISTHSCDSCCLLCLEVTRGLGENGSNFLCNMGATHPIGIFHHPPSQLSMQLCGFDILSPSHNSYLQFFLLSSMPWISSLPHFFPPLLLPPSVNPIIACRGCLRAPNVQSSLHPLATYTPPYHLPVPTIVSASLSTQLSTSIILL